MFYSRNTATSNEHVKSSPSPSCKLLSGLASARIVGVRPHTKFLVKLSLMVELDRRDSRTVGGNAYLSDLKQALMERNLEI